jgi:hypothetical protein
LAGACRAGAGPQRERLRRYSEMTKALMTAAIARKVNKGK